LVVGVAWTATLSCVPWLHRRAERAPCGQASLLCAWAKRATFGLLASLEIEFPFLFPFGLNPCLNFENSYLFV
jgi:hypothetical protein